MSSIKISPKHGLNPSIPVCFWCGQTKNEVVLLGKINKNDEEAPRNMILNYEPCDSCKEQFSKGIHVIGVKDTPPVEGMMPIMTSENGKNFYPTGSFFVATQYWAARILDPSMLSEVLQKKKLLMDSEIVDEIIKENDRLKGEG